MSVNKEPEADTAPPRRTDEEIAADIKTCALCDNEGRRFGLLHIRRDQVPEAFLYQDAVYIQREKRTFYPLQIRKLAPEEVESFGYGVNMASLERAKVVASVLSDHGLHVSSPDDGDLDDVERERWDACVEIARRLS